MHLSELLASGELAEQLLAPLPPGALCTIRAACRALRVAASIQELWKGHCTQLGIPPASPALDWMQLFAAVQMEASQAPVELGHTAFEADSYQALPSPSAQVEWWAAGQRSRRRNALG